MNIIIVILFLGWVVFSIIGNSQAVGIIRENNLFKKKWHTYKMGFSRRYIKGIINNTTNNDIKANLLKAMSYLNISNYIMWLLIITFLSIVIYNNW